MMQYRLIVYSDPWEKSILDGDALADWVDAGIPVLQCNTGVDQAHIPQGRFKDENYVVYSYEKGFGWFHTVSCGQ
eukprot:UN24783